MKPRITASSIVSSNITERSSARSRVQTRFLQPASLAAVLAGIFVLLAPAWAVAAPVPDGFRALEGAVTPKRAVPYSVDSQRIIFRFKARRAADQGGGCRIASDRVVRRFVSRPLRPGRWHRRMGNGFDRKDRLVSSGRCLVKVGPAGGRLRVLARTRAAPSGGPIFTPI
jgi:hypothetical protein